MILPVFFGSGFATAETPERRCYRRIAARCVKAETAASRRLPTTPLFAFFQDPDVPPQAGSDFGNADELHPIGVAALAALSVLALVFPRRLVALPLVLLLCFIPSGQRLVLVTLDFSFLRLLMLVLWVRLLVRNEVKPLVWNHFDRLFLVWAGVAVVTGTLQSGAFVNRAGVAADAMMQYFFFRQVIRNRDDLIRCAMMFLLCSIAIVPFFVFENRTARNMFHVLGGVPEITEIRDGRLRCQGPFAHPILAGCFWACLIPIYFARGLIEQRFLVPIVGMVCALIVIVMCASSTPIMAVLFTCLGGAAFFARGVLRWVRWLLLGWVLLLHFALMKAPVWHLLARVDILSGSTGHHRYALIDAFVARAREWWLVGCERTGHWGYGLQDITNQFVAEGVSGGIVRLALFVALIWLAFAGVSRTMRTPGLDRADRIIAWTLGTVLFVHCLNFLAVSYFGQIVTLWFATLAAINSLTLVPGAHVAAQLRSAGILRDPQEPAAWNATPVTARASLAAPR